MSDQRYKLKQIVLDVVREDHGDTAVTVRPTVIESLTTPAPVDPRQAIEAARQVSRMAEGLMYEYAKEARGAGISWADLVEPLGVGATAGEWSDTTSDAFKLVAPAPSQPYDRLYVFWRCQSCDQLVTDYGPYNDPGYDEKGHADDCARHAADIAAYEAKWADDEDKDSLRAVVERQKLRLLGEGDDLELDIRDDPEDRR